MPVTVKICLGLFGLIALCWFGFAILMITGLIVQVPVQEVRLILGGIALACSIITALAGWLLSRKNRAVYFASTVLLGMILIVSFMDDLGLVDFLMITITAVTLGLLIKNRTWFLQK